MKKNIKNFKSQQREAKRDFISGESHYYGGRRYLLKVIESKGYAKVSLEGNKKISLKVPFGSSAAYKEKIMNNWYRKYLKEHIPPLLVKWEKKIKVKSNKWGVRIMKTKWGSCNIKSKSILFNLELAKKPIIHLEYVIVHELIHLHEKYHNNNFKRLMDKFLPKWRLYRDELNNLPVPNRI